MTIANNTFIDNHAPYGGAILLDGCKGEVVSNVFVNNSNYTIYLDKYYIKDFNTTINGNWWGQNDINWSNEIKNLEIPDSIITLNFTVDSYYLKINQSTNYTADFYLGNVKAVMPKRNITFSSDGGNLTNTSFNAATEGKYTLTASSDNENYELEVYVSDNLLNLRVDDVEKYVGAAKI